ANSDCAAFSSVAIAFPLPSRDKNQGDEWDGRNGDVLGGTRIFSKNQGGRGRCGTSAARLCLTTATSRFEVEESSAAAARHNGLDFTYGTDYRFIDTLDASIGMREEEAATTHLEVVVEEGDRILAHQLSGKRPRRYRRYFSFVSFDFEREAMYARGAWSRSENRSMALEALIRAQEARITALEAQITTLQTQHGQMEW
ncbi:hypothetical protein Tco_0934927, partial [Tanacetum coccineum]